MATLHHKAISPHSPAQDTAIMREAITAFLSACRKPAFLDYGEPVQPLVRGGYCLEERGGRLWVEIFSETRTISRRIVSVEKHSTGVLDCTVHRFGAKPAQASFLDLDRPQTGHKTVSGARRSFGEQFRRMLTRQFPDWKIKTLTASLDLRRSFSSVFPRACLIRGNQQLAALACPTTADEPVFLTFALIWLDYVRSRAKTGILTSLVIFLPENAGNLTSQRTRWLSSAAQPRMFRFNAHGSAGEVDARDLGNLQTRVQKSAANEGESAGFSSTVCGHSERAFEMTVRRHVQALDSTLLRGPVHSQVLAFAAGDRDLIDLVAVSALGRLAILELKVSEDLHLPVQALDYWMRIKWHAERNELQHLFPAIPLAAQAPKLLLVAPAMAFHSSCATVLRYLSSEIEVERVGVNSDWQEQCRVVLRLRGGDDPISHRSV